MSICGAEASAGFTDFQVHSAPRGDLLHRCFLGGFIYKDCGMQDALLIVLYAIDAAAWCGH